MTRTGWGITSMTVQQILLKLSYATIPLFWPFE
jgi:hypothetical protein